MFLEIPDSLTIAAIAAFLSGWVVAKIGSYISSKLRARHQDPRDVRIRSLEADVRVAQTASEKAKTRLDELNGELTEANRTIKTKDTELAKQANTIVQLRHDLRESVRKTRELREELTERATENARSEGRLREVQTELSVVQASTDMLATGMLDYLTPDGDGDDDDVQIFKAGG